MWFDLDDGDDAGRVLSYARRLGAGLVDRYGIGDDALLIFYSSSKGYHVGLPMALCGSPAPSGVFHRVARRFAEATAERLGLTIDNGVYDRVRLFRSPNSRHQRMGRYKRRVTFDELMGLRHDAIEQVAAAPEPFDVPTFVGATVAGDSTARCAVAVSDWNSAADAVAADDAARVERRATVTGATLNRRTLDFIREGAIEGDRHRLLYSAAANLGEFGASYELALALLNEAALDSGLPPSDVARQIKCCIEGGRQ